MSRGTWTATFRIDRDLWDRFGEKVPDRSAWLREQIEALVNGVSTPVSTPVDEDVSTPVSTPDDKPQRSGKRRGAYKPSWT